MLHLYWRCFEAYYNKKLALLNGGLRIKRQNGYGPSQIYQLTIENGDPPISRPNVDCKTIVQSILREKV
jgi:hypothetical protein